MLVTDSGRYDDAALAQLLDSATRELTTAGVGPGTAVVLCLPDDARWVAVSRALAGLGAVSVPMNAGSAISEIAHVLDDSGARLAAVPAGAAATLAERFPDRVWWPDGRATGERITPGPEYGTETATIAYTSGTTGRPKGVLQSRRAVALGGESMARRLGWTADDVVVTALPLAHSYGTNVLDAVLAVGASLVALPRFDETRLLAAADRWGATVLAGVPTMYRRLLAAAPGRDPGARMARLRCVVSAGQSAGADLAREWESTRGGAFVEGWGMTELAGFATLAAPDLADRHGTAGTAMPEVRIRADIVDPEHDSRTGELWVAGPMVTAGHLGAGPPAVDGWLPTGDLGSIDADGRVRILGRRKDVVLSGGFSIYPAEVERVVARHPDVAEVAVAGLPDPMRGEVACAWIVPRAGTQPSVAQIAEFCRPHLAIYKLPRRIVLLPELPLNGTGKVLRRELPAPVTVGATA
ncbi:class I adenylate-forming enzyme family protein [Nocardia sp. NPDC004415]